MQTSVLYMVKSRIWWIRMSEWRSYIHWFFVSKVNTLDVNNMHFNTLELYFFVMASLLGKIIYFKLFRLLHFNSDVEAIFTTRRIEHQSSHSWDSRVIDGIMVLSQRFVGCVGCKERGLRDLRLRHFDNPQFT